MPPSIAKLDLTFTRRDCLIALLIALLAFGVRCVIILDRAASPIIGAFDPIPEGTDQSVYYHSIQEYRAGTFPPPRYFFQPGMPWLLIAISALMRTDQVGVLRLVIAWLAAVNCGVLIAVARLAFGRRRVAVLAGLLLAIYPVGAFYDTDFVIVAQATQLVTLALLGVCWLWRSPQPYPKAFNTGVGVALIGLSFGGLALLRFELLALAPVFALFLIVMRRDRLIMAQLAIATAIGVGVVLPTVLHNRANGADYLITPVGSAEIYRGNSRDSDGTYGAFLASQTTSDDYLKYLWQDIMLSPRRFIELELHKIGLYLSAHEPGNNLNYVLSGVAVSPLLRINPLNFNLLIGLFLLSWPFLFRVNRAAAALFGFAFLAMMASTLLIWVEARIRTPVIVVLIPVAAYGVVAALQSIRALAQRRQTRPALRNAVFPILIAGVLIAGDAAERQLPLSVTVNVLPAAAQPLNAIYDSTLQLLGWQVQAAYSPAGIIQPFRPYVVSLYWQLLQPTTTDYSFAFGLYIDGERLAGFDHPIGSVGYPAVLTSRWTPGLIYVEHLALNWKRFDGPLEISGELLLSVYPQRDALHLLAADNLPHAPTQIQLARPAIIVGNGRLPPELAASPTPVTFGGLLTLKGWHYPARTAPGDTLSISLGWQRTDQPIVRPYTIFLHLVDAAGQMVAQKDSPPRDGRLLTTSLPSGFQFADAMPLTMPAQPGTYTLVAGIYDSDTQQRLSVPDATDGQKMLGQIVVEPG